MRFTAKRYDTESVVELTVQNGVIEKAVELETKGALSPGDLPWIGPGFFDIQINGCLGIEFSSDSLKEEDVAVLCKHILNQGVYRFCPTITTNSSEVMLYAVKTIVRAIDRYPEFRDLIAGIHLEGPFISRHDGARGAHPKQYCREYDRGLLRELIQAGRGLIRILTLSPEYEGADDFIQEVVSQGILTAIGHTNADPIQVARAVDSGARLSTHLSNGTNHQLAKAGNYCFAQMAEDRLYASIICDAFHIMPMLMRMILRTKGPEKTILISDQASVAGLAPGLYSTGLCHLEIMPDGKVALTGDDHLLAGAWYPVSRGVMNIITVGNLTLEQAMNCAVKNPAMLLNLPLYSNGNDDFLAVGAPADFIIFRAEPARFSKWGIEDSAGFQPGKMNFEHIIYRGKNITIESSL